MKKCSTLSDVMETESKAIMRYFSLTGMTKIRRTKKVNSLQVGRATRTGTHYW